MEIKGVSFTFKARDGYTLGGTHWQNDNPKGIVAINPGTAVDQKLYQKFAHWLAQQNYDVLTYDYRGIGTSAPPSLKRFKASIIDWAKLDIAAVIDWMVDKYPQQKKYIIGHSMGGQVIGLCDNFNQIDKLIAFVPSYGNWQNNAPEGRWKMGLSWAFLFPIALLRYGYFPANKRGWGNDWPGGVAWDWWSWGFRRLPHYKIMENKGIQHFYHQVKVPMKAYFTIDDKLASKRCIPNYELDFASTDLEILMLRPTDYGVDKIAHMGMFSAKCKQLWVEILRDFD